ncbi:MAG: hypothetical protein GWP10_20195 [Nitrospiraceae bacterium]|nr:hypothetical protein [Nitrospiraceae bacterium]
MINAFIIMGNENSRKSSTIRALTGAYNKGIYKVATRSGNINIFVQISSLQESKLSPTEFINSIKNQEVQNVLVPLWISEKNNNFPSGCNYIHDFQGANWNIKGRVVLGTRNLPCELPTNVIQPEFIPNSTILPANEIASKIRNWWNWL